jgi:hypothetical protein
MQCQRENRPKDRKVLDWWTCCCDGFTRIFDPDRTAIATSRGHIGGCLRMSRQSRGWRIWVMEMLGLLDRVSGTGRPDQTFILDSSLPLSSRGRSKSSCLPDVIALLETKALAYLPKGLGSRRSLAHQKPGGRASRPLTFQALRRGVACLTNPESPPGRNPELSLFQAVGPLFLNSWPVYSI